MIGEVQVAQIGDLIRFLGSDSTDGYGPSPIPSPLDEAVRRLLDFVSRTDDAAVAVIIPSLTEQHGFVLVGFAERMAAYAVRTGQERYIHEGLTALGLASLLLCYNEVLPALSLLYRSTQKIGSDANVAFATTILADVRFQSFASDFLRRGEQDRSIEAMGYVESQDQDGFRYSRTW
jgi:hypothetical protein